MSGLKLIEIAVLTNGREAHCTLGLDLAWAEKYLILLAMWSFIHGITLAIWQEIVFYPITQAKTIKRNKNKEDLAKNQWSKRRSGWMRIRSITRLCGGRRSNNSSNSEAYSLLQSMIIHAYLYRTKKLIKGA